MRKKFKLKRSDLILSSMALEQRQLLANGDGCCVNGDYSTGGANGAIVDCFEAIEGPTTANTWLGSLGTDWVQCTTCAGNTCSDTATPGEAPSASTKNVMLTFNSNAAATAASTLTLAGTEFSGFTGIADNPPVIYVDASFGQDLTVGGDILINCVALQNGGFSIQNEETQNLILNGALGCGADSTVGANVARNFYIYGPGPVVFNGAFSSSSVSTPIVLLPEGPITFTLGDSASWAFTVTPAAALGSFSPNTSGGAVTVFLGNSAFGLNADPSFQTQTMGFAPGITNTLTLDATNVATAGSGLYLSSGATSTAAFTANNFISAGNVCGLGTTTCAGVINVAGQPDGTLWPNMAWSGGALPIAPAYTGAVTGGFLKPVTPATGTPGTSCCNVDAVVQGCFEGANTATVATISSNTLITYDPTQASNWAQVAQCASGVPQLVFVNTVPGAVAPATAGTSPSAQTLSFTSDSTPPGISVPPITSGVVLLSGTEFNTAAAGSTLINVASSFTLPLAVNGNVAINTCSGTYSIASASAQMLTVGDASANPQNGLTCTAGTGAFAVTGASVTFNNAVNDANLYFQTNGANSAVTLGTNVPVTGGQLQLQQFGGFSTTLNLNGFQIGSSTMGFSTNFGGIANPNLLVINGANLGTSALFAGADDAIDVNAYCTLSDFVLSGAGVIQVGSTGPGAVGTVWPNVQWIDVTNTVLVGADGVINGLAQASSTNGQTNLLMPNCLGCYNTPSNTVGSTITLTGGGTLTVVKNTNVTPATYVFTLETSNGAFYSGETTFQLFNGAGQVPQALINSNSQQLGSALSDAF